MGGVADRGTAPTREVWSAPRRVNRGRGRVNATTPGETDVRAVPEDLLRRALERGDDAAFAAVCRLIRPALEATCAAIIGRGAAEDAVQEALLKIWLGRRRYDPSRSSFATWSATIARHTAIDIARSTAIREEAARVLERVPPAYAADSEERILASDARRAVRAAAAALPADQRHAVFASFWLGHTHSEAAVGLGIPLGTLKGRVRAALSTMRPALDEASPRAV